jgi:hypothetical protein
MITEPQIRHGNNGEVTELRAEHDLTLHELADTLDELSHGTDFRERSRFVAMCTRQRFTRTLRDIGKRVFALAAVFGAAFAIAYAAVRRFRRRRRALPWHRLGFR